MSGIKVSSPAADGTRQFAVTPDMNNMITKETLLKITVGAEDIYGLKATSVTITIKMHVKILLFKICTLHCVSILGCPPTTFERNPPMPLHYCACCGRLLCTWHQRIM